MALEHGHVQALFDRRFTQHLSQADDALTAKTAGHYFDSLFHIAPVLLILSTVFQTCSLNSTLEPVASW